MSSVFSTVVMGTYGLAYLCLGCLMLKPVARVIDPNLILMYASLFKALRYPEQEDGSMQPLRPMDDLRRDLSYRLLAYLLIVFGVCRIITGFSWDCGYVYLGLWTCVAECAAVCHELLCMDGVTLHRAMCVLVCNVAMCLLYVCSGVPACI